MQLIETTVTATAVRMRYANSPDPTKATEWLDFQVPMDGLMIPLHQREEPLGDQPDIRLLAEVRLAALRRVRGVIGAETQRLSALRDPTLR